MPSDGTQLEGTCQFLVAARGRDHARAGQPCELEREERDAAGPLDQDRVARLDAAALDQGVPGRHARARQGGGFLEAEMSGDRNEPVLGQHGLLGQQADAAASQRRACFLVVGRSVHPARA